MKRLFNIYIQKNYKNIIFKERKYLFLKKEVVKQVLNYVK